MLKWTKRQRRKRHRKLRKESQMKFDAIKYSILGEPKGLTTSEVFDKSSIKSLFKSQDEISDLLIRMREKGFVYRIENRYIWI